MGNHRAERRAPVRDTSESQAAAGKRRAIKHAAKHGPLFRGLPSAPILMGVAALAISAGGAVTVGETGVLSAGADQFTFTSQISALNGASGTSQVSSGSDRGSEASRDSSRDALTNAASTKLQAAVEEQAQERSAALSELAAAAEQQAAKIKENRWILPVSGYHITNTFGMVRSYYSSFHTGLDFACPSGTEIHAIANGVISDLRYDGSYGNLTVMTLDDGTEIWYGHQTAYLSGLSVGDTISQGEVIGYVGSTGNSTGPHVHIEVRPGAGDPVDPYPAFVVHGVTP
jgi:murein DD-endopeptidase MepM/ murein hydrolase activator NlpD